MCRNFKRENREWERSGHRVSGGEPELLELIAKDPRAFILKQGEHTRPRVWFSAPSLKTCVCNVKSGSLAMHADHAARARHRTREGACAPLRSAPPVARAGGTAVALRASSETNSERDAPEHGLRRDAPATEDESVIGRIVSAQREELELESAGLKAEAEKIVEDAGELAGEVPF